MQEALKKVPIFKVEFLTNLIERFIYILYAIKYSRQEEGIKLRQNTEAQKYLLAGAKMFDAPIAKKYRKALVEAQKVSFCNLFT